MAASLSATAAPTFDGSTASNSDSAAQAINDARETTEDRPHYLNLLAQVTSPSVNQIEELSRQILLKCVELERYNLNYRQTVAKQSRWKGWRYFLSQFGGNSVALSGYIVGTVERGKNFQKPARLKRKTLEDGNAITMIGAIIGGTGTGIEFLINAYHEVETHMKGFSPKQAKTRVLGLKSEINSLLAQRAQLISTIASSGSNPQYVAVANAEEAVLKDIRDISLKEFVDFHVQARRLLAFQQSLYLGDIARQTTGAIAARFGWRALRYGNRHNNLDSGIFQLISGTITIANPVVSREIGFLNGAYNRHYVRAVMTDVGRTRTEALAGDVQTLHTACESGGDLQCNKDMPILRASLYSEAEHAEKAQLALSGRELHAGYIAAAQNIGSGAFIGGLKVTGGVLFSIAGNRYRRSSLKTNVYLGTTNILNTVASGYAMFDNLRIQLRGEYVRNKLKKQHQLPGQIIGDRLAVLNKIEQSLKTPISDNNTNRISMLLGDPDKLWVLSGVDPAAMPDLDPAFAPPEDRQEAMNAMYTGHTNPQAAQSKPVATPVVSARIVPQVRPVSNTTGSPAGAIVASHPLIAAPPAEPMLVP